MARSKRSATPQELPRLLNPSTKPHQLLNGLWNCPRCTATFASKETASYHLIHEHDTRRAIEFKEVIEVKPHPPPTAAPAAAHELPPSTKADDAEPTTKHLTARHKSTAEILGPNGPIRIRRIGDKWPCPLAECTAMLGSPQATARHINSTNCYALLQAQEQPAASRRHELDRGRVPISTRIQCKHMGISMEDVITDTGSGKSPHATKPVKPNVVDSPLPNEQFNPESIIHIDLSHGKSVITVLRDAAMAVTTINFLDAMDPWNPPLSMVYPRCQAIRSRVRAARVILLDEVSVSDPNAPNSSPRDLIPLLLRTLPVDTVIDHLQSRYYGQSPYDRKLENFRIRGIVAIHQYFGQELPPALKSKIEEAIVPEPQGMELESSESTTVAPHFAQQLGSKLLQTPPSDERELKRTKVRENELDTSNLFILPPARYADPEGPEEEEDSQYPSPVSRGRSQSYVDTDALSTSIQTSQRELMRCKTLLQKLQDNLSSIEPDDAERGDKEAYFRAEIEHIEDQLRGSLESLREVMEVYRKIGGDAREVEVFDKFTREISSTI